MRLSLAFFPPAASLSLHLAPHTGLYAQNQVIACVLFPSRDVDPGLCLALDPAHGLYPCIHNVTLCHSPSHHLSDHRPCVSPSIGIRRYFSGYVYRPDLASETDLDSRGIVEGFGTFLVDEGVSWIWSESVSMRASSDGL